MERTFNSVIRAVANRNNLELLGHIHGAADDLNVLARNKGLLVKHSFDFKSDGDISFWIGISNENYDEIYSELAHFDEYEEVIEMLNKAYEKVADFNKGQKQEEEF